MRNNNITLMRWVNLHAPIIAAGVAMATLMAVAVVGGGLTVSL